MPDQIDVEKRALRAEIRERRQLLSEAQRAQAAETLTTHLDDLLARTGARSISCYLSTTTEPDTRPFVNAAVERGIRVLLPVTRADGLLDWAVASPDGDEIEGLLGIPEPDGELLGPMEVDTVDLLLIPAAAVGPDGTRLGWGRGYFDKTIGSMEKCPPVYAIVYDSEYIEDVPRDVHDQPVDGIVTPTRIVDFTPAAR